MKLVVQNNWVTVLDADKVALGTLDEELRYKTEQVRINRWTRNPVTGWDGWVRMLKHNKEAGTHYFPTGLLGRAVRHVRRMGFAYEITDERKRPPLGQPVGEPIPLFDYQTQAANGAVEAGRGVIDSSPRSGKTRTLAEVVRRIALPTLWVAPTDRIVKQTVATLHAFMGDKYATHLIGGKAQANASAHAVVVCTAATAAVLTDDFLATREVLVVDEWHHAAAASYREMFARCGHIYFRFGMTGTHYRSGDDAMAMESLLGNTIFRIGSEELVRRGRLIPVDVVFLPTRFEMLRGVDRSDFVNGFGKHGAFEHVQRNQLVAHTAAYLERIGRKVLVLVRTKIQGRMIAEMMENLVPKKRPGAEFDPVQFVSTDTRRRIIDKVIHAYNESNEVRVLIGTSLIGEGTDLPMADAMLYAAAGKAEVTLIQNAYRVATKMDGKPPRAIMVDFGDRHHSALLAQSQGRLHVYRRQATFDVHIVHGPRAFMAWLAKNHASIDRTKTTSVAS